MGNYNQFSIEERSVIQAQLTLGFKPSWIAVGLPLDWVDPFRR